MHHEIYQRLHKLLEDRARSAMDDGDFGLAGQYARAVGELQRWYDEGQSGDPPKEAGELGNQADLEQLRAEWRKTVVVATTAARQVRASQPDDVVAQRTAWQAVQQVEPNNQEAEEALWKLDAMSAREEFRKGLSECRQPLKSRDIRHVEDARSRAQRLLEIVKVHAPELIQETQKTLDDLNKMRDDIVRISGDVHYYEMVGDFEKAIAVYRNAIIVEKLAWIVDDTTGQYIQTSVALLRARNRCFANWSERASHLHRHASEDLEAGLPDIAVGKLEEAQALLEKVEEGGEDLRKQVMTLLKKARDQKKIRDRANEFVLKAINSDDPLITHTLLAQAKHAYAAYPNIDSLIQASQDLILRKPIKELREKMDEVLAKLAALQAGVDELRRKLTSES